MLKDLNIPEIGYDLQLAIDLEGGLEELKLRMNLASDDVSVLKARTAIPLDNGILDCTRPVHAHMMLPERQLQQLATTMPIFPDVDVVAMMETTVTGNACSPNVQVFTQGHTPVGNAG